MLLLGSATGAGRGSDSREDEQEDGAGPDSKHRQTGGAVTSPPTPDVSSPLLLSTLEKIKKNTVPEV